MSENNKRGLPAPNHTQIPNILLDKYMALMSNSELRVVLALARKTIGWHKQHDRISLTQLMDLTGLSKQAVVNGLNEAIKRGFVEKHAGDKGKTNTYTLVIFDTSDDETDSENDATSQRSRLVLVNVVDRTSQRSRHTKETNQKKIQKKKDSSVPDSDDSNATDSVVVSVDGEVDKSVWPNGVETLEQYLNNQPPRTIQAWSYNELVQAIRDKLKIAGRNERHVAAMLLGNSKTGEWQECNIEHTHELWKLVFAVREFPIWYDEFYEGQQLPQKADALNKYFSLLLTTTDGKAWLTTRYNIITARMKNELFDELNKDGALDVPMPDDETIERLFAKEAKQS